MFQLLFLNNNVTVSPGAFKRTLVYPLKFEGVIVIKFVPLDDVDTFGGSIVTEWYAPDDDPYKRLKLAVLVVVMELRSDAIQGRAYVQVRSADKSEWITAGRDKELARKLEDLILARARELRAAVISESSN